MQYRLEGEPRYRPIKSLSQLVGEVIDSPADWVLKQKDPITGVESHWGIASDKRYAQRTDILPDGNRRFIQDWTTQPNPHHDLSIYTPEHTYVALTRYQDRRDFRIGAFTIEADQRDTQTIAQYTESGWLKQIDVHVSALWKHGQGIEMEPREIQDEYYKARPLAENLRELAQIRHLKDAKPAHEVNIIGASQSELDFSLLNTGMAFIQLFMSPEGRAKLNEKMQPLREALATTLNKVLGDDYTIEEKVSMATWFDVHLISSILNPVCSIDTETSGMEVPVPEFTDESLEEALNTAATQFIIAQHNEIRSASNLHLVVGFDPDADGESFNYRVLGSSAVLIYEDRRCLGEDFTYGEDRFSVDPGEDPNQVKFKFSSILRERSLEVFGVPKFVSPETMDKFEEIVGTKSNQGWEQGLDVIDHSLSGPQDRVA